MKLSFLQSDDEGDSENLAQVLRELRDSEAKLVSMLGETTPDEKNDEIKEEENIKVKFCGSLLFS